MLAGPAKLGTAATHKHHSLPWHPHWVQWSSVELAEGVRISWKAKGRMGQSPETH